MSKSDRFETAMLRMLLLLCTLTLFSFWMLGNLYAKYAVGASGTDSARTAVFEISDDNNLRETYVLNPAMTGTDEQKVQITVKNSSEVAVRYTFSFETEGNLPLEITASAPEGVSIQKDASSWKWVVEKEAGSQWNESYHFVLSLEDAEDNYQYAGGVESIQLTVTSEQID